MGRYHTQDEKNGCVDISAGHAWDGLKNGYERTITPTRGDYGCTSGLYRSCRGSTAVQPCLMSSYLPCAGRALHIHAIHPLLCCTAASTTCPPILPCSLQFCPDGIDLSRAALTRKFHGTCQKSTDVRWARIQPTPCTHPLQKRHSNRLVCMYIMQGMCIYMRTGAHACVRVHVATCMCKHAQHIACARCETCDTLHQACEDVLCGVC